MIRILFLCAGNICRSPVAAGAFSTAVQRAGLEHAFLIDSAGTHATTGRGAHPETAAVALTHGVDLAGHRSRRLEPGDHHLYDYVVAMDAENAAGARAIFPPSAATRIFRLLEVVPGWTSPSLDVPDPFLNPDGFRDVHELIARGANALLEYLRHRHSL